MNAADSHGLAPTGSIDDASATIVVAVLDADGIVVAANTSARETMLAMPGLRFTTLLLPPNETDGEHAARWLALKGSLNRWLPLEIRLPAVGACNTRARLERAHGGAGSYIVCLLLDQPS